jgi:uncharacterized membrane protein
MADEFINPNWHVVFLHFPIALLAAGIIGEIVAYFRPRGALREASRWMILLGGLIAIPTGLLGLYAFRDTVMAGPAEPALKWSQIVARSQWSEQQWHFMWQHLVYNALAVLIVLGVIVAWIATSERTRRRYYCPMLTLLAGAFVLMNFGSWHGGEAVYRLATAVEATEQPAERAIAERQLPQPEELEAAMTSPRIASADVPAAGRGSTEEAGPRSVEYFLSPLQLHLMLAGFAIAPGLLGLALLIRRGHEITLKPARNAVPGNGVDPSVEVATITPFGYSRGLWIATFIVGILAALAGAWAVMGSLFSAEAWQANFAELREPGHTRLLGHAIVGTTILVSSLVLGLLAWFTPNRKKIASVIGAIFVVALLAQLWLGVAMLYDSHEGPLHRFNADLAEEPSPSPPLS